ncbi:MAG: GNAT family N-acetyltransferase [Candidatus Aminicenantales bacterium]
MTMEIKYEEALPEIEAYFRLFLTTGWNDEYGFTLDDVAGALGRSWYAVSAYAGSRLVGFGRVLSDGVHHALIVDMIVDPEFQGRGIGSGILRKIIDRCRAERIRDVQLFAAKGRAGFYGRHGFAARPGDAPGMQLV